MMVIKSNKNDTVNGKKGRNEKGISRVLKGQTYDKEKLMALRYQNG
jgi:hypothetical protein